MTETGGTVKSRMIYRSGHLSKVDAADVIQLERLNLRTLIDLRRTEEVCNSPSNITQLLGLKTHATPLLGASKSSHFDRSNAPESEEELRNSMMRIYRKMVIDDHSLSSIRSVFTALFDLTSYPLVIHCSAGKDRTGLVCALILSALGVRKEDIINDYYLSQRYFTDTLSADNLPAGQALGYCDSKYRSPQYAADPSYLLTSFDAIKDTHGTLQNFFESALNISQDKLTGLRDILTE